MNPITQQLKRVTDDERAVSPVVGFVLMFALIMIVFTIYQAEVVPAQNAEVEFKHSQTIEAEMSQLNDAIQQAGTSGVPQSATIATGVQYPNRAFAINPGSPVGSLKTSDDTYSVKISGLATDDGKLLDGSVFSIESRQLRYEANYNVHQGEPTVIIENGLLYTQYEEGTIVKSADIISGNRINLPLIHEDADYQESRLATSVSVEPVSASTEYVTVESDGDPTITLETGLTLDGDAATRLEEHIEEESTVDTATYSDSSNQITIDLKAGTYKLRMTEVAFGGVEPRDEYYLTSEDPRNPDETTIETTVEETETFTVSARDELGNPISGADVDVTVTTGEGTLDTPDETDDDGRLTFSYTPDADDIGEPVTIEAELVDGSGDPDLDTVTYELEVSEDSTDGGDGGIGEIANGYDVEIVITSVSRDGSGPIQLTFENRGTEMATAKRVRVSGFFIQGDIESSNSVTFEETSITFNGNMVALDDGVDNNEYDIAADGGTVITELEPESNQGGFLIMDIEYEIGGSTETGTYAITIPGNGNGNGGGN